MAILTTSREFGSGNMEVVREIMASMHYTYVDKSILFKEIHTIGGKWEQWARELDDSCPTFFERYDRSFKGFGAILQSIQLRYALEDNVILRGRGANFLMEGIPHAYRIRVIGSLEDRIHRVAVRDSVDQETARWLIEKSDRERAGFVHALYGKDARDPQFYDAVFDKGKQCPDEIIATVKQALLARDALKTDAAQRLLSLRAVAARIKAKVIMDSRLYVPVLEVDCSDREIVLRGIVRNSVQYEGIVETARELAGDTPVKVELRYRA